MKAKILIAIVLVLSAVAGWAVAKFTQYEYVVLFTTSKGFGSLVATVEEPIDNHEEVKALSNNVTAFAQEQAQVVSYDLLGKVYIFPWTK